MWACPCRWERAAAPAAPAEVELERVAPTVHGACAVAGGGRGGVDGRARE